MSMVTSRNHTGSYDENQRKKKRNARIVSFDADSSVIDRAECAPVGAADEGVPVIVKIPLGKGYEFGAFESINSLKNHR